MKYSIKQKRYIKMKNLKTVGLVLMLSSTVAHAVPVAGANNRSSAGAIAAQMQGQIGINKNSATAIQKGNDTNISIEDNSVHEAYDRDNTPAVSAPALVVGATTCLGSATGGMSIPGFGFTAGGTKVDEACQAINGSIRFAQLGLNEAAVQIMCSVPVYAEALSVTGYECETPEANAQVKLPKTSYTSTSQTGMFGR